MNSIKFKNRLFIALQTLFCIANLLVVNFAYSTEIELSLNSFFIAPLKELYRKNHVVFVEDANNKQFVLKHSNQGPENSIHDTLGARVALSANVNINNVKIFKPHDQSISSVDKYFPDKIKTPHTFMPGEQVGPRQQDGLIEDGLVHERILKQLTKDNELCKIIAADMYLNNQDRHDENLLEDNKTKQYYAIDMDYIFYHALFLPNDNERPDFYENVDSKIFKFMSTHAADFLKNFKPGQLSHKEIKALEQVNATLSCLISNYPPEKLYKEWMNIAQGAGYTYSDTKQKNIQLLIKYNFEEIKLLQAELERLTDKKITTIHLLRAMAKPSKTAQENFWQTINA